MPEIQLLRDVFNTSPIGIAVENFDGQPLFVNPAFCSFLGFSEKELCHKYYVGFAPNEDGEKDWGLFQQLKAGSIDHYQLEKRYFRKDGSTVWGRLSISLLSSRPSPVVIAMVEDITDQKKAEETLFRHAAIVESSDDAISSVTLDGLIVTWNAGAERMFGYTENEAIGKPASIIVPPELRDQQKKILERLRAGGHIEQFETVRVSKTGKRIDVSLSISPVKDATGKIVGCAGIARDITERKAAEEALRESEQRFRAVADTAPVLIWMSGVDKLCTYFNKPWLDFTGRQVEEELGNGWAVGVHPDDRQAYLNTYNQSFDQREKFRVEYRLRRYDGEYRWILDIGKPRFNQDRSFAGYIGIAVDVTDRKMAEQELTSANERLGLAIQAGSAGGWDFDLSSGKNVWFGKAHAQLGMAHDETIGSVAEFWAHVHEEDCARLERALRISNQKHEEFAEDFRVVWRDGTIHWLRSRGRYYYAANGEPERMLGISADITQSKQAEQALREMNQALGEQSALLQSREELLRVFVKNVPAAVAMLDRDMRYLQVSDRWCSDYSPGRTEILGRSHYEIFSDMPERWKEVHRRALQGETLRADEDRWDGRDGPHWARWEVRPWMTAEGQVGGILILAEDITRRKQMEEALSDMSRKLIESQERERTRIASELHDDIGQRLALIAVELENVQADFAQVSPEIRRPIGELQKQMQEVSVDVQALSHDLHSSRLEYLGVAAGIKSWCKEFAERQRVEIEFASSLPNALAFDVGLSLFRVLQEALHNATKHSGVKRIEVQLREDSGEIHLIVRDSGKGFDVQSALQGKGLGLTSMRERIRLVNGTISIESVPMGGTTIHVRVPLGLEKPSERAAG
jgi:PAS domain S-box-containing protein